VTPRDLNYITSTIVAGASHRGTIKKPQQLEQQLETFAR